MGETANQKRCRGVDIFLDKASVHFTSFKIIFRHECNIYQSMLFSTALMVKLTVFVKHDSNPHFPRQSRDLNRHKLLQNELVLMLHLHILQESFFWYYTFPFPLFLLPPHFLIPDFLCMYCIYTKRYQTPFTLHYQKPKVTVKYRSQEFVCPAKCKLHSNII